MRATVRENFQWGLRFLPEVRSIVGTIIGPELLVQSNYHQDTKEASDLVVLQGRDLRVAVRIRRHEYFRRYPTEFTIRSLGRNGAKTEFDKIVVDEWGDYLFYGFASPGEDRLLAWFVGDLNVFRDRCWSSQPIPSYKEHRNPGPDETRFASFDIGDFPPSFIRAHSNSKLIKGQGL